MLVLEGDLAQWVSLFYFVFTVIFFCLDRYIGLKNFDGDARMKKTGVTVKIVRQYDQYIQIYLTEQKKIRVSEDKIINVSLVFLH